MQTVICNLRDMKYPLHQGGMVWWGVAPLAASVSRGGGGGTAGAGGALPCRSLDTRALNKKTNMPFGVNIMHVEVMLEKRVPVVTTGDGNPQFHVSHLEEPDTEVIPVIASTALAKHFEPAEGYALVAEGVDSGDQVFAAGGIADGGGLVAAPGLRRPRGTDNSKLNNSYVRLMHG